MKKRFLLVWVAFLYVTQSCGPSAPITPFPTRVSVTTNPTLVGDDSATMPIQISETQSVPAEDLSTPTPIFCNGRIESRISPGMDVIVVSEDAFIYSFDDQDSQMLVKQASLKLGTKLTISGKSKVICKNDTYWWLVSSGKYQGWIAETVGGKIQILSVKDAEQVLKEIGYYGDLIPPTP